MSLSKTLALLGKLENRRKELRDGLRLPADGLPGSLSQSHRRCGNERCHCFKGPGHLSWALTFMVEGKKRVEYIPHELVDEVQRRMEAGNTYKRDVAELMAINAQMLILERRARREQAAAEKKMVAR